MCVLLHSWCYCICSAVHLFLASLETAWLWFVGGVFHLCTVRVHRNQKFSCVKLLASEVALFWCPQALYFLSVMLLKTWGKEQHGNVMISLSVPVTGSSVGWFVLVIQFRQKCQQRTGFLAVDLENKTNGNLAAVEQLKVPRYNHRCAHWMVTLSLLCPSQMALFNYLLAEFMAVHPTAKMFIQQDKRNGSRIL